MQSCIKRLEKERTMAPYLSLSPLTRTNDSDSVSWTLEIPGPPKTPYEGFQYSLQIHYEHTYPFRAPFLRFRTPIFHPNIHPSGQVSNLMTECWNPVKTIQDIYDTAYELLREPLKEYPYNDEAAALWEADPAMFYKVAKAKSQAQAQAQALIASQHTHPSVHPGLPPHHETVPVHTNTGTHLVCATHSPTDAPPTP